MNTYVQTNTKSWCIFYALERLWYISAIWRRESILCKNLAGQDIVFSPVLQICGKAGVRGVSAFYCPLYVASEKTCDTTIWTFVFRNFEKILLGHDVIFKCNFHMCFKYWRVSYCQEVKLQRVPWALNMDYRIRGWYMFGCCGVSSPLTNVFDKSDIQFHSDRLLD